MTSRRLLSVTASLALAAAGFSAPAIVAQGPSAVASPTVSASSSTPTYAPAAVTAGTRAQTQAVTMPTKRIRIRSRSDNPVVTIISPVLAVLIVGGASWYVTRYLRLRSATKPRRRCATAPTDRSTASHQAPTAPRTTRGRARPSPAPRCTAPERAVTSSAAIRPAARRAVKDPTERDSDSPQRECPAPSGAGHSRQARKGLSATRRAQQDRGQRKPGRPRRRHRHRAPWSPRFRHRERPP